MDFELNNFSFIYSSELKVKRFANLVIDGDINETEINEKFDEIKEINDYTEEEANRIIQKISIAAYIVPIERTDYQVPSGEALIYMSDFIKIKGSINLKILYALFDYIVVDKKDENNNNHYYFRNRNNKEVYPDFRERLHYLNKKDKQLETAKNIEKIFNDLNNEYNEDKQNKRRKIN